MAWDEFERNGQVLMSGDEPLDELSLALRRIGDAYRQRFGRLPTVGELLLSLERILAATPARFVEDPDGMEDATLRCERPMTSKQRPIDYSEYEGFYKDEPEPGFYGIEKRGGGDVLRAPRLEVKGRVLEVDYEILDPALDDDSAIRLIKRAVLRDFSDSYYQAQADEIVFRNLQSGQQRKMPYDEG